MRYEEYISTPEAVWFDSIPASWRATKMRAVFLERNEKVSDKDFAPLSVGKMGVVPQLETAVKTDNGDNRKLIRKGDFAINSRSDRKGAGGISVYDGSASLIITVLKPHHELNGRFYHYLLRNHYFSEEFYRNGHGLVSDLWTTKWDEMRNIYIPVPSREEQEQIVRYLDWQTSRINRLIHGIQREINLLEERRGWLINRSVTQGIQSKVPLKDSGIRWIGKIPIHWNVLALKKCASLRSGITLGKQYPRGTHLIEVLYLRVANVQNGFVDTSDIATISVTTEEREKYALSPGEVLMTEGGDRDKLGRGCVWNGSISPCIHQNHVYAISTDPLLLNNFYLEYLTVSNVAREYFDLTATKTTNLASTNSTKVLSFPIPVPPIEEQIAIVSYLKKTCEQYDSVISKLQIQIAYLKEYRTRLISDVVTGQMDVRSIEIPEYTPEDDKAENGDDPAE